MRFRNGGHYHYSGVDAAKFEEMKKAESIGRFLGTEIKGKHAHRKIDQDEGLDIRKEERRSGN